MAKITEQDAQAAYETAKALYAGQVSERDAVDSLVASRGLNRASASDLVRNYGQMWRGAPYHRTLSVMVTKLYLEGIGKEEGPISLVVAIGSVLAHCDYYEKLATGGKQNKIRELCHRLLLGNSERFPKSSQVEAERFQNAVSDAMADDHSLRKARLSESSKVPIRRLSIQVTYSRNPDIVAEALWRANGQCEFCKTDAPFNRKSGSPFLEVHHITPLAEDGTDTLDNVLALCPNCHREAHFGEEWEKYRKC